MKNKLINAGYDVSVQILADASLFASNTDYGAAAEVVINTLTRAQSQQRGSILDVMWEARWCFIDDTGAADDGAVARDDDVGTDDARLWRTRELKQLRNEVKRLYSELQLSEHRVEHLRSALMAHCDEDVLREELGSDWRKYRLRKELRDGYKGEQG